MSADWSACTGNESSQTYTTNRGFRVAAWRFFIFHVERASRKAHNIWVLHTLTNYSTSTVMKIYSSSMALASAIMVGTLPLFSTAYSCGGYACRPNSPFRGRMRTVSPQQRAEFSRQADFVNRAFEAMADDLRKSTTDPVVIFPPKQKEYVDKAVEFFAEMGGMDRQEAKTMRDIANRGFEMVQDLTNSAAGTNYSPTYDIQDMETEIEISLDVPGVSREDIDVLFEEGVLKVSGTRKMKKKNDEETEAAAFSRSFPVDSQTADTEVISASLENGVLSIRIPKKEVEKPAIKRIDIL
jgi:HSP20 family protein